MMDMDTINLIMLLFPGVVSIAIINFLIKKVSVKDDIIGMVFYSGLNYVIIQAMGCQGDCFIVSFIIAVVLAGLSIWLVSIEKVKSFIIKTRGSIFLTAWDSSWRQMSLSDTNVACEVKLKDGEVVRGLYTKGSSASFSYNKDGIFLSKVIEKDQGLTKGSKGILIPHNEISYIKFYKGDSRDER